MSVIWSDKEIEILKEQYHLKPTKELSRLYFPDRSDNAIHHKAWTLNLHAVNRECKYTANRQFFSKPNITNSYFAGWLAADGWIAKNCVGIECSAKDSSLLENFKQATNSTYPIKSRNRGLIKGFPSDKKEYYGNPTLVHRVYSANEWINDLNKNWSINPNKTKNLQPPNLIDQMHKYAYIIGYFDGDGHINRYFHKQAKQIIFQMGFTSCSEELLIWIREQIKTLCPNESWKDKIHNGHKGTKCITWSHKKAINIHKTLREIVDISYKLKRKWNTIYPHRM